MMGACFCTRSCDECATTPLTREPSLHIALYSLTIFLSSAALMALEIAAARLLAPYIGVSLYSWTAIIGVVLSGLSLDNWFGGVWTDRGGAEAAAGWMLGAGHWPVSACCYS